jgi:hypothetical protein
MNRRAFSTLLLLALSCLIVLTSPPTQAAETNGIPKVSISELLRDKQKWKSKRVDVTAFLRFFGETSAAYDSEQDAKRPSFNAKKGLHVNYSGCPSAILIDKNRTRIVGTFEYDPDRGCGHLNQWPAEIVMLESAEPVPAQLKN